MATAKSTSTKSLEGSEGDDGSRADGVDRGVDANESEDEQRKERQEVPVSAASMRARVYLWLSSLCFVVADGACREVGLGYMILNGTSSNFCT